MLTEGGVTLGNIAASWGIDQSDRAKEEAGRASVKRNWDRMAIEHGDGAGIAMLSQYLLHTDA